jgi:hypothetical protein
MGAVWPFVTGFVALGHYEYGRPWSGYPLLDALARMAFDWARGRHPELLSGAFYRPLDTAVPQQFFATSMLASAAADGLLGWEPDAPAGRARLAPQLPPQWERMRAAGLRAGGARLDVTVEQAPGRLVLRLEPSGAPLSLEVRPALPPGARGAGVAVDGEPAKAGPGGSVTVDLDGRPRVVEARWTGGLSVEPPLAALEPGQADRGVHVLSFEAVAGGWALALEGPAGGSATLRLHGEAPASAEGASLAARGAFTEATVAFPPSPSGPFSRVDVALRPRVRPAPGAP